MSESLADRLLPVLTAEYVPAREIATRFQAKYGKTVGYGSLYIALSKLEARGLAASTIDQDDIGPVKKFKRAGA